MSAHEREGNNGVGSVSQTVHRSFRDCCLGVVLNAHSLPIHPCTMRFARHAWHAHGLRLRHPGRPHHRRRRRHPLHLFDHARRVPARPLTSSLPRGSMILAARSRPLSTALRTAAGPPPRKALALSVHDHSVSRPAPSPPSGRRGLPRPQVRWRKVAPPAGAGSDPGYISTLLGAPSSEPRSRSSI